MIPDLKQRLEAVLAKGHAFVQASAGTGKTHTLTLRALYMLLLAPFDPRAADTDCAKLYKAASRAERLRAARALMRRFVLTTFTRKAAAEMQTRLYSYLDDVASSESFESLCARAAGRNGGNGDDQFIKVVEEALAKTGEFEPLRLGAEALAELATELQVCTLHSFAAAILRRHPVAAGIPPTAQFAEEDQAESPDLAEQVIERWWQVVLADGGQARPVRPGGRPGEESLPDSGLRAELERLVEVVPLSDMPGWLEAVYRHRWIADEMDLGKPDENLLGEIFDAFTAIANHPKAKSLKDVEDLRAVLTAKPLSWTALCRVVYDKRAKLFLDRLPQNQAVKLKAAINSLPAAQRRFFKSLGAVYPHLVAKCIATEHADAWERWKRFIRRFAEWADEAAVRELGIVTFDDMVRLAVRLLKNNPDIRAEERKRLWAILVDEFQDTDPVQLELLEALLGRDSETDHEVLGFFVGDAKQSIYRFRGADLPAIENFRKHYSQLVKVTENQVQQFRLTANFRTLKPITDFVNHFFQNVVPLPDYAGSELAPVRAEEGTIPDWRLLREQEGQRTKPYRLTLAARETARLIEDYRRRAGGDDKAYSDIVVLVRKHEEMDALLPVLEEAGIPVVSSGAKTFYRQPEVLDALNVLIALHNPQDALAVGALLRSPLFGLSDEQIFQLQQTVSTRELFHGAVALPESIPTVARARIGRMRALVAERTSLPLGEWLRRVRLFIPANLYAAQDAEGRALVRIQNVLAAFARVVALGTIPPLTWLLEQRARANRGDDFDADLGEDVSVTDESMAAVRAMTIHKAKGLEGKCVIVFGWQTTLDKRRQERPRNHKPLCLTDRNGETIRGFQLAWGPLQVVSPRYPLAEKLNQELEAEEARRLAYVAATRARDELVLLSAETKEISGGLLSEAKDALEAGRSAAQGGNPATTVFGGTLRVTVAELCEGGVAARPAGLRIGDPGSYAKLWLERAEAVGRAAEPLLHKPSQPERPEEDDAVDLPDYVRREVEMARELALQAGTLAHRYLERHLTDTAFEETKLQQLIEADLSVAQAGIASPPALEAVAKAAAALKNFFGSKNHLRAARSKILGRECPVFLTHNGMGWSGVIDLVLEERGTILGVDYKLMAKPESLPAEYEQQRAIYTEALRRLFPGREVAFEFWWLGD